MQQIAADPSSGSKDPKKPWFETPLVESASLSRVMGCRVFLKLENLQPSGSFKSRNIGGYLLHAIQSQAHRSAPLHFYTSSGGNAGLAAVIGARSLGYPCSVVVPNSCKPMMIEKLKTAGAVDVVQTGDSWLEADTYLRQELLSKDTNGVYVPPFDHETIWEAASGIVEETERQLGVLCDRSDDGTGQQGRVQPDAYICSVGGGGLFCGIARGVARSSSSSPHPSKTIVFTSETVGADSLASSVQSGQHVTLPGITSIATSLGAVKVCKQAYDYATDGQVKVVPLRVTDVQAVKACAAFVDDERILVEPACGAALAPLYEGLLKDEMEIKEDSKVVVVVCGGSNISLDMLADWRKQFK